MLRLQVPGVEKHLEFKCEVAWTRGQAGDGDDKPAGMGVKFCETPGKGSQVLKQFIAKTL